MKNLTLFVATVAGYFGVWWYIGGAPESMADYALRLSILALLSAPWNIRGDIWTVLGNAESEGSIYSLFSLYQEAAHDAVSCFGVLLYQKAGDDARFVIGVLFYQDAGSNAKIAVGVSVWQKAGNDAILVCGISAWQEAGRLAFSCVGIMLYQKGQREAALLFGASIYQEGADTFLGAGVAAYQRVLEQDTVVGFGIALYQNAKQCATVGFGIALCQNTGGKALVGAGISLYQSVNSVSCESHEMRSAEVKYGVAVYQTVPDGKSIATKSRTFGIGEFSASK